MNEPPFRWNPQADPREQGGGLRDALMSAVRDLAQPGTVTAMRAPRTRAALQAFAAEVLSHGSVQIYEVPATRLCVGMPISQVIRLATEAARNAAPEQVGAILDQEISTALQTLQLLDAAIPHLEGPIPEPRMEVMVAGEGEVAGLRILDREGITSWIVTTSILLPARYSFVVTDASPHPGSWFSCTNLEAELLN